MTTFEDHFVQNKFDVLPITEQETISNYDDDAQDIFCKLSRRPTVCIVKYKKFTMLGRTKQGLDEERKTKKRIENKKEGKHPSKRAHWPRKKKSFHKKGPKKQKKSSKHNRTMRKRFFQAEQIKVYKKSRIERNSCNLNIILSYIHLTLHYMKENFDQANCVTSGGRKTGWAPSLKLLGGGDRVPENSK